MTLTAAAKIELIETALADGKYRTLQKQLRELRDEQQIIIQGYLSDSHESLKEEAQRLIDELRPIVETQDAIETVEQRTDEVLASLPTETIADNNDSERQTQTVTADLAWKEQLPKQFQDAKLIGKFCRIFNQLNKQGISVYYDSECSDKVTDEWKLIKGEKVGFLYWFKTEEEWELHGFTFQDENGNPIDKFNDVKNF